MSVDLTFDKNHLWHPYTSTTKPTPCYPVVSAKGVRLTFEDGTEVIDGMASWWSAIHGYNVPELNEAIAAQTAKMSHVMFGGLTHEPAVELARKLIDMTPMPLQKVFIADSGSIAVEVALKMAIQYWAGRGKPQKTKMVTVNHGYHGDSFGAMSVCDPVNGMHSLFDAVLAKALFIGEIPQGFDTPCDEQLLDRFEQQISQQADTLAAFIIEPVVQGAGGMRIYNPQWLTHIRRLCDQYDILLILDEIATGFGRTGKLFGLEHADICPDILCLGKAISGGYLSLAATLATDEVASGVCASEAGVFMHGPTFMGNPLACSVANASLTKLFNMDYLPNVKKIEQQLLDELMVLKELDSVSDVRVLGAIGIIEMAQQIDVSSAQEMFIKQGVWMRPYGKLLYVMPPFIITATDLTQITQVMTKFASSVMNSTNSN